MDKLSGLSRSVHVELIDGPLSTSQPPADDGAGASLEVLGIVRLLEEGRPLLGLDYTAYEPMAQRQLERIAMAAIEQHGLLSVCIEHSRGFVGVGEVSLRLSVASKHRKASIQGIDTILDALKRDVPIWKRPCYRDDQDQGGQP